MLIQNFIFKILYNFINFRCVAVPLMQNIRISYIHRGIHSEKNFVIIIIKMITKYSSFIWDTFDVKMMTNIVNLLDNWINYFV